MKTRWVILLVLSFTLYGFVAVPGRLKRAFEALEVYNYFKAKDLFYRSLKRDSVPASFGLATIYSRNDNPFFHPDSAFKFAGIAHRGYAKLDAKHRAEYAPFEVDSTNIQKLVRRADSLVYVGVVESGDIATYGAFIQRAHTARFRNSATAARDSLAYRDAYGAHTAEALRAFIETYPQAAEIAEAEKLYHQRFYHEQTASGTLEAYRRFATEHRNSPYWSDAEYHVFELSTASQTPESYAAFIRANPQNEYVDRAWQKLYLMEVGDMSAKSIAAFSLKYPDFPDPDRLKRDFDNATTQFYRFESGGKWGYIDEMGEVRIAPVYEWNEPFEEGLAIVGIKDKAGFVDKTGKLITPVGFDEAFPFRNGFALVEIDGKYGAINRAGNWVIPPEYHDLGEFNDGLFFASKGNGYGYINANEEVVIDFVFDNATDFESNRAVVERGGKNALLDRSGKILTDFEYDWIERFPEGHLPARMRVDGRFGLIDRMGVVLREAVYAGIGDFGDGLALATDGTLYGFIDARGDTAIGFTFTYKPESLTRSRFSDGYAPVFQKDLMGIIDTSGTKVFPAIFEDVGAYRGALIPVKRRGKWGYADTLVNLAIPYRYSSAGNFRDSIAVAAVDGRFGLIDTRGREVLPFQYRMLEFVDSLILATDTAVGLIDVRGTTRVPAVYQNAEVPDNKVIRFIDFAGHPRYFDYRRMQFLRDEEGVSGESGD